MRCDGSRKADRGAEEGEGSGAVKTGSLKRATEMRQEQQAAAATVVQ